VDADVRDALLDIESAQKQVEVAESSVELANEALSEAQQRYANGVSDNLAVSQAQQSVAQANDQYVTSLYRHNVAKLSLARAWEQALELQELSGRKVNVADSTPNTSPTDADEEDTRACSRNPPQSHHRRRGCVLALVAAGIWWRSTYSEDTDDAQVNGHLIQVSARIGGPGRQGLRR
jgi:hypothetical protein